MLVDDGVIRRDGDDWELAVDADAVEVPPTIQSLLATRVERLPAPSATVLELASVIGPEFALGALREPGRTTTAELDGRARAAAPQGPGRADRHLLGRRAGLHRFHHVLIRDAVYRRLLKGDPGRAARAGRRLDRPRPPPSVVGEHEAAIAYHYEQAQRTGRQLGVARRPRRRARTPGGRAAARRRRPGAGPRRPGGRGVVGHPGPRPASTTVPDDRAELLLLAAARRCSPRVTRRRRRPLRRGPERRWRPAIRAWRRGPTCFGAQLARADRSRPARRGRATAPTQAAAERFAEARRRRRRRRRPTSCGPASLARLGRVGDCEVELDLALGAAREADDRRRIIAVLGAAPVAALWGPSPVARAGGRCLDVVRLLRITAARRRSRPRRLRCQAVLEALRGRFDTARSLLTDVRSTVEELGLRRDLMEIELFEGIVELLDRRTRSPPRATSDRLRRASARWGRRPPAGRPPCWPGPLLAQGRVDEADGAGDGRRLAGQNLKTAIAWGSVRAEIRAARGDSAGAVAAAEEAVAARRGHRPGPRPRRRPGRPGPGAPHHRRPRRRRVRRRRGSPPVRSEGLHRPRRGAGRLATGVVAPRACGLQLDPGEPGRSGDAGS